MPVPLRVGLAGIGQALVLGVIERDGDRYFNSAVVIEHGALVGVYRKTHLAPGESLFNRGDAYPTFELRGTRFGINICHDTRFAETAAAVAAQGVAQVPTMTTGMVVADIT